MLWDAGDWLPIPLVMKFYREEARRLRIQPSPLRHLLRRSQIIASIVPWLISYVYPSQRRWFERLHLRAWGRAVSFPPGDVVNGAGELATKVTKTRTSRKMFPVSYS